MNKDKKLLGAGVISAIAASLCCIAPLLAILAGTSGLASTFSWLEPARPFFIGLTVVVLAWAWYQKLQLKKTDDCGCEPGEKERFIDTKSFLGIVTFFAGLMLSFPYYSSSLYPAKKKQTMVPSGHSFSTAFFSIQGMTCAGCENTIHHEINQLPGILEAKVSYPSGSAKIQYDSTLTDIDAIDSAINLTGYSVIQRKKTH